MSSADVYYEVIKSLRKLKWKVNERRQEKLAPNECYVIPTAVNPTQETTDSYLRKVTCIIGFITDNPISVVDKTDSFLQIVEYDVMHSGVTDCTSFMFEGTNFFDNGGTMVKVEQEFSFRRFVQHG